MSRQIDFSKPISEEDAAYVADRPWLVAEAEQAGFEVKFDEDFTQDAPPEEREALQDPDTEYANPNQVVSVPGEEEDEEDSEEEADDEEVPGYADWEYQALKDEAGNRDLSKSGSKEQLIARLEENDAASAE